MEHFAGADRHLPIQILPETEVQRSAHDVGDLFIVVAVLGHHGSGIQEDVRDHHVVAGNDPTSDRVGNRLPGKIFPADMTGSLRAGCGVRRGRRRILALAGHDGPQVRGGKKRVHRQDYHVPMRPRHCPSAGASLPEPMKPLLVPLLTGVFLALCSLPLWAVAPSPGNPGIIVTNLVPRFMAWFEEVEELEREMQDTAAARDQAFDPHGFENLLEEVWREHLGDMGGLLARDRDRPWEPQGLGEAWSRYRGSLDRIRRADDRIGPEAEAVLHEVAGLLRLDRALDLRVIVYVGTFNDGPAFRRRSREYSILLPAERLPEDLRPVLIDLYSRAIHARLSGRPADDDLSLAQHLFLRGLALRVHEEAEPGLWAHEYLLRTEAWLVAAEGQDGAILNGLRGHLDERDPERLARLMDGAGATGFEGEFDYAAWRISGMLLMEGWTLDRLARVPEGEVGALVAQTLRD